MIIAGGRRTHTTSANLRLFKRLSVNVNSTDPTADSVRQRLARMRTANVFAQVCTPGAWVRNQQDQQLSNMWH